MTQLVFNEARMKKINIDITIVTIFRNEGILLTSTIESIKNQDFTNFECLLIDGNSTDESVEISTMLTKGDPRFCLVKQSSTGISNAFNEGIRESSGQYIIFLNGGDLFSSKDSLGKMIDYAKDKPEIIHAFRSEYIDLSGKATGMKFPEKIPNKNSLPWHCSISHQGALIPRSFFIKYGGFLPVLKVAMDYEIWLRALVNKYPLEGYPDVVAYHRMGGVSFQNINLSRKELILCRILHLGLFRKSLLKDFCQALLILFGKLRVQ